MTLPHQIHKSRGGVTFVALVDVHRYAQSDYRLLPAMNSTLLQADMLFVLLRELSENPRYGFRKAE
jgi:hypothetical protein